MMNNQSKQMVVNALINVINAEPGLYSQKKNIYALNNGLRSKGRSGRDISVREFNTWMDYANQVLDISYNHIGLNDILSAKIAISQLSSQNEVPNEQRIEQIKQELFKLTQTITQC